MTITKTALTIQVSDEGGFGEWSVYVVGLDEEGRDDEHDSIHTSRIAAERRAAKLAKQHGCEWETNYPS